MNNDLQAELVRVAPTAKSLKIGSHEVYQYSRITPAHEFTGIVNFQRSRRTLELIARDSFSEHLATEVLDKTQDHGLSDLDGNSIRVNSTTFSAPYQFDSIVIVPPPIAKRFVHESDLLSRSIYWIFPAYQAEFEDGADYEAFWHQIQRKDGWRVHPIDWNRSLKDKPTWD